MIIVSIYLSNHESTTEIYRFGVCQSPELQKRNKACIQAV